MMLKMLAGLVSQPRNFETHFRHFGMENLRLVIDAVKMIRIKIEV